MYAVLLTIEVVVCIAMIGVILLQRSEGGGLGMGGGGGMGGLMTGRGAANALTRATVILATIFITTSIALTLLAKASRNSGPLGDSAPASAPLGTLPTSGVAPAPAPVEPSPTPLPSVLPGAPLPATSSPPSPAPADIAPPTPSAPAATQPVLPGASSEPASTPAPTGPAPTGPAPAPTPVPAGGGN